MADELSQGFDGLEGIETPRDVHVRNKTKLEILLETSERVLVDPNPKLAELVGSDFRQSLLRYSSEVCEKASKELNNVPLTETDLEAFILHKSNLDMPANNLAALGIFTGALAQIITERNAREGKRTRIYINGQGKRFDYLFLGAHNVDEIYVHNLRGNYICANIQSASKLVGISLYGDYIFNYCGDFDINVFIKGVSKEIKEMVLIGIECENNPCLLNKFNDLIVVGIGCINLIRTIFQTCYADRMIGVNLGKTRLGGQAICDKIVLMGAELVDVYEQTNTSFLEESSNFSYQKKVPLSVIAGLHRILYADSICSIQRPIQGSIQGFIQEPTYKEDIERPSFEEYAQHKDCLNADKLAAHLKDKPKDEIMKIVDDIIRYANELSERLLMK